MADINPFELTLGGRLSYPVLEIEAARQRNLNGDPQMRRKPEEVTAEYNLLLTEKAEDKARRFLLDSFFPAVLEKHQAGDKKYAKLDKKKLDILIKLVEGGDWSAPRPPHHPFRPVPDQTQVLAPEAKAMIKIVGSRGRSIEGLARVNEQAELKVADTDIVLPSIQPIGLTNHELYAGAYCKTTINFYAYMSGQLPGFSASSNNVVFIRDDERFGGGGHLDEDALFSDDDDE